jgi:hypothetical protein
VATQVQVVFDCTEPDRLAGFWASALHYQVQGPPEGYESWDRYLIETGVPKEDWNSASAVVDPDGVGPRIYFQRVPETKVLKNRVHLDLNVGGGRRVPLVSRRERVDAEVGRLVDLGAISVRRMEEYGEYCVVMQDPEGNEFCVQ